MNLHYSTPLFSFFIRLRSKPGTYYDNSCHLYFRWGVLPFSLIFSGFHIKRTYWLGQINPIIANAYHIAWCIALHIFQSPSLNVISLANKNTIESTYSQPETTNCIYNLMESCPILVYPLPFTTKQWITWLVFYWRIHIPCPFVEAMFSGFRGDHMWFFKHLCGIWFRHRWSGLPCYSHGNC